MNDVIQPFDLYRIFIGDQPWWFGLEIAGRTVIMYVYTLWLIRSMGTRTMGQLSLIEFLLVIGIGSAVGDPMVYHDVPLLHGMIVVTVVVALNRWVLFMINNSERFEHFVEGGPKAMVSNGRMHPDHIRAAGLNREKLFELLRTQSVRHLGEIEQAFLEQGGQLSIYRRQGDSVTGLRVMPPWDLQQPARWSAGDDTDGERPIGCEDCGHVIEPAREETLPDCPHCGGGAWVDAVVAAGRNAP